MRSQCLLLPCLAALQLTAVLVKAVPVTLYDGTTAPEAQGWVRVAQGRAPEVTVGLTTTEFNTEGADGQSGPQNEYVYNTGTAEFVASINMRVISATYNPLDPGLIFGVAGYAGNFSLPNDRSNSLAFAPGLVLWSDNTGPSYSLDTSIFHEYSLRYLNGNLDFFVDAPHADIIAGTAVPVLSRPSVAFSAGQVPGVIAFGDFTNDANYNSHYIVDSVTFDNFAVPEPGVPMMLALGLGGMAARRRR